MKYILHLLLRFSAKSSAPGKFKIFQIRTIEDLRVDIFGDVGITTFYNNYSFTKDNQKIEEKGRVTLVFLNTEEGWKIIHELSSPFKK